MIQTIRTWLKTKRNNKAIDKIKEGLLSNPSLLLSTQEKYEHSFGKNSDTRTRIQWQRLVKVYGMKTVCRVEKMTENEIRQRCEEKFAQKILRELSKNK